MTVRLLLAIAFFLFSSEALLASERKPFTFTYVMREGDPAYEPQKAYTGLSLRDKKRPIDGAMLGYRDSRILGRAIGLKFKLEDSVLTQEQNAAQTIRALLLEGRSVFLIDLPFEETLGLAKELSGEELLLFNIRHHEDGLRGDACSRILFHSIPSHSMLMDSLSQFLVKKNWKEVLILEGEEDGDRVLADAFQASADKFGLEIEDRRTFKLGKDPRERAENNIALLTSDVDYDVIFVADSLGEVGRTIPYNSQDPRPVVGSEGLVPNTWHWTFERYGAPQLNQRFEKIAKRKMVGEDWAAWAAVRVVVEALTRGADPNPASIREKLLDPELTFDSYKGEPASFRPWNNQMRQALLLHTHNVVVARAPIEGFLHQTSVLDTLGVDKTESNCIQN